MNPRLVPTLFSIAAGGGLVVGVAACAGGISAYKLLKNKDKHADKPAIQAETSPFTKEEIARALHVDPDRIRKISTDTSLGYLEIVFKPSFDAHGQMSNVSADLKKHDVENFYFRDNSPSGGPVLKIYRDGKEDFNNYVKNKNTPAVESLIKLRT